MLGKLALADTRTVKARVLGDDIAVDRHVLIGSNTDEWALFLVPSGIVDFIDDARLDRALTLIGADAQLGEAGFQQRVDGGDDKMGVITQGE